MDAAKTEQLLTELRAVVRDAEELLQAASDQTGASETVSEIEEQVRRNPWAAVGIAAGIGLVLGLLLSRK